MPVLKWIKPNACVSIVTLYNNAIGLIGLIAGDYMYLRDMSDCVERYGFAISDAQRYGFKQPRRWMAKHGGVFEPSAADAKLGKQYRLLRAQIAALIPKQEGEQLVTYGLRL